MGCINLDWILACDMGPIYQLSTGPILLGQYLDSRPDKKNMGRWINLINIIFLGPHSISNSTYLMETQ